MGGLEDSTRQPNYIWRAYQSLLKADGLTQDSFKAKGVELKQRGDYRRVIEHMRDPGFQYESTPEGDNAIFTFTLPASTYATVCLRELMHNDVENPFEMAARSPQSKEAQRTADALGANPNFTNLKELLDYR